MTVYLIRHGETPPRPGKPSDGNSIGLTPEGKAAALRKAEWFKYKRIHKVIASPLARARETAGIIAAAIAVPLVIDERAAEFVPADVAAPDFKLARDHSRLDRDWAGEGGESFNASLSRFKTFLDEVSADGPVCIVTHELILQNLLMVLGYKIPPHLEHLAVVTLTKDSFGWHIASIRQSTSLIRRILKRLRLSL
ncbi:histidine phosphatase family protein [Candidatus Kaiserbacteria bacterium]|nr:histidine phosphatase family protein [Candidatus Kaiserbacteria bacterium]